MKKFLFRVPQLKYPFPQLIIIYVDEKQSLNLNPFPQLIIIYVNPILSLERPQSESIEIYSTICQLSIS